MLRHRAADERRITRFWHIYSFKPLKDKTMAKIKNPEYKQKNEAFIQALRDGEEELFEISQGVLVKILKSGSGERTPRPGNVVTVNYKGSLINGKVLTIAGNAATPRPSA